MSKRVFNKIKCVAFDLDGTLYLGDKLVDGALELLDEINSRGWQVLYVTNNSSRTRHQIYQKLQKMGMTLDERDVMNSAYAVAQYLSDNYLKRVYCLGTANFAEQIASLDIDPYAENPEAIVIGYDPEFNLNKLEKAIGVFHGNCKVIAANFERTYLTNNAVVTPGAGPIVKAFEYAVNKRVDVFVGKPHALMLEMLLRDYDFIPEEILVVGDTYESDVAMANLFGASAVLIYDCVDKIYDKCVVVKNLRQLLQKIKE